MDIAAVLVPRPEGNVGTEEARYQRQPLEKMQRWWVAGLMCSGWLQAGAGLDIQYVLYHTKNSLFVPRFGQTHCACYMPDFSHTHLESCQMGPSPRHRGSKLIFPVLLLGSFIYRRCWDSSKWKLPPECKTFFLSLSQERRTCAGRCSEDEGTFPSCFGVPLVVLLRCLVTTWYVEQLVSSKSMQSL